jgi:hypothetical protein
MDKARTRHESLGNRLIRSDAEWDNTGRSSSIHDSVCLYAVFRGEYFSIAAVRTVYRATPKTAFQASTNGGTMLT